MSTLDALSIGALVLLGLILLILLLQSLRLRGIWQMMLACRTATRWARIWEMENRELRSALRAEKAHVEQLQGKLKILQSLLPTS
ncbi:hypothetical protein [Pseudomonas moorei]|uniref:hypothetical protein n=1 Tax=Pseudomonas moorei TaxID=395599 RepID=UPI001FF348A9|nr:hypothetical protein [Pseudomonas moorei]